MIEVMTAETKRAIENARTEVWAALNKTREAATVAERGAGGREIALAITKLQEAYMWLDTAIE